MLAGASPWPCRHHFEKAKVPFQADIIKENLHRGEQSVANRICDMAARLDANAVVMASHRIGKLSEFILGSIAMQCVHNCSAPVIVLHPRQDVSVKRSPTRKLGECPAAGGTCLGTERRRLLRCPNGV